ncbi:hypothetical protein LOTGIDRAFT_155004 [Lottia gigantea]|uniref:Uncharacterized protein n=1 Tax=Lottia gigantea TaxID=225164 RepID=V3ZMI2_LOTGI|nr:hypothetical protein LOTGIDRAFT_155004 [Lottia gigantea]ESO85517.1 hypothetical protein LOTGIDRAFT_155004 [Lottia gigantea]
MSDSETEQDSKRTCGNPKSAGNENIQLSEVMTGLHENVGELNKVTGLSDTITRLALRDGDRPNTNRSNFTDSRVVNNASASSHSTNPESNSTVPIFRAFEQPKLHRILPKVAFSGSTDCDGITLIHFIKIFEVFSHEITFDSEGGLVMEHAELNRRITDKFIQCITDRTLKGVIISELNRDPRLRKDPDYIARFADQTAQYLKPESKPIEERRKSRSSRVAAIEHDRNHRRQRRFYEDVEPQNRDDVDNRYRRHRHDKFENRQDRYENRRNEYRHFSKDNHFDKNKDKNGCQVNRISDFSDKSEEKRLQCFGCSGRTFKHTVIIAESLICEFIIGSDFMRKFGCLVDLCRNVFIIGDLETPLITLKGSRLPGLGLLFKSNCKSKWVPWPV